MKKIFILAAVCFSAITTFAQAPLEKGDVQLNGGVGFSTDYTPVYVGLDYGVGKNFTIGGEASYRSKSESFVSGAYSSKYTTTAFSIGANANYHFGEILDLPSKWDIYGGVTLAYYNWSTKIENSNSAYTATGSTAPGSTGFSGQAGVRYFFTNNFGVNVELGGGNISSGGKAGITYKF